MAEENYVDDYEDYEDTGYADFLKEIGKEEGIPSEDSPKLKLNGLKSLGEISAVSLAADGSEIEDLSAGIIGPLLGGKAVEDSRLTEAYSQLGQGEILRGEDWAIWRGIESMKRAGFVPDSRFLVKFLAKNRKLIDEGDARGYINLKRYDPVAGDNITGFIAAVVARYDRLKSEHQNDTLQQYRTAVEDYRLSFSNNEFSRVLAEAGEISGDGLKKGRKFLQGVEDATLYIRSEMAKVEGLLNKNQGTGFINMEDVSVNTDSQIQPFQICLWGIPSLDAATNGIMSGRLMNVLAPPKSGKTKFVSRVAYNAMRNGVNVSIFPVEGGVVGFKAQLRAIHFDSYYNAGAAVTERKLGVDQGTIMDDTFADNSTRQLEQISLQDLETNEEYGHVQFVDKPFLLETLIDDLTQTVRQNNSSLVIIDYMQLIHSSNPNKGNTEALTEIYPQLLQFCRHNNVTIISPIQYRQEDIRQLTKGKSGDIDLRAAAGGSSEIIRSSDFSMGLWGTPEDLKNNLLQIIAIPSRFGKVFDNIKLHIDLGTCRFEEDTAGI